MGGQEVRNLSNRGLHWRSTGSCSQKHKISDPRDSHGSRPHRDSDVNRMKDPVSWARGDPKGCAVTKPRCRQTATQDGNTGPDTHEILCQPRSEVAKTQIISEEQNNWGRRKTSVALAALVVCWGNCHLPSRGTANSLLAHKPRLGWDQRLKSGQALLHRPAVSVVDGNKDFIVVQTRIARWASSTCRCENARNSIVDTRPNDKFWSPHREPGITN
mgnify:CR=1 FL=1